MANITNTVTDAGGNIIKTVSADETDSLQLATADTYIDKNIAFNIRVKAKNDTSDTTITNTYSDETFVFNVAVDTDFVDTSDATAAAEDITSGKTAYVNGEKITGTATETSGLDTSDATATAADIVSGLTAYVKGTKLTGTLTYQAYYTGEDEPSADLGEDGDIYFKTTTGGATTGEEIGAISSTDNSILLTSTSLASDTYTLYYEDASGNKLEGWSSIGTISN